MKQAYKLQRNVATQSWDVINPLGELTRDFQFNDKARELLKLLNAAHNLAVQLERKRVRREAAARNKRLKRPLKKRDLLKELKGWAREADKQIRELQECRKLPGRGPLAQQGKIHHG